MQQGTGPAWAASLHPPCTWGQGKEGVHLKLKAQRWQETSPKSQSLGVIWLRPRKLMEYLWSGGYTLIDKIHTAPAFVKFIGWCERWWINQRTNLLIQKDRLCHLRGWE